MLSLLVLCREDWHTKIVPDLRRHEEAACLLPQVGGLLACFHDVSLALEDPRYFHLDNSSIGAFDWTSPKCAPQIAQAGGFARSCKGLLPPIGHSFISRSYQGNMGRAFPLRPGRADHVLLGRVPSLQATRSGSLA